MYGVQTSTAIPCSPARRMTSCQKSCRVTGSTPVVGSSSSSRRGRLTRAQARASFCFIPPESFPARRSSKASSPTKARFSRARGSHSLCRQARALRPESGYFPARSGLHIARIAAKDSRSARGPVPAGVPAGNPPMVTEPLSGLNAPQIRRRVVVLPAPSGPTSP